MVVVGMEAERGRLVVGETEQGQGSLDVEERVEVVVALELARARDEQVVEMVADTGGTGKNLNFLRIRSIDCYFDPAEVRVVEEVVEVVVVVGVEALAEVVVGVEVEAVVGEPLEPVVMAAGEESLGGR